LTAPAAPAPARGETARFDEIDALRAVAMTAVIAQHCRILPFGWMGVWLFFVISGFVVTTSLVSRPSPGPAGLLAQFYGRRAARILPIYLGYVVIGFVVSGVAQGRLPWPAFASLLLFYNNFQVAFGGVHSGLFAGFPVGHLWTISVEMQFYLLFGFAFAFCPRRALAICLAALLVLAPLSRAIGGDWMRHANFPPAREAFAIYAFSAMQFDSFAAGALLALASPRWRQQPRATGLLVVGCAMFASYALAYALVNRSQGATGVSMLRNVISGVVVGEGRQIWVYSAVAALSLGVMAVTLTGSAAWSAITSHRLVQAVGRASYGGYVYHALCVTWIGRLLHAVIHPAATMASRFEFGCARFALAWPATVILAVMSYRFIERPIMAAAGRRLAAGRA